MSGSASEKEELAAQCLRRSRDALAAGDMDKAQRFAEKAQRAHAGSAPKAQALLAEVARARAGGGTENAGPGMRQRRPAEQKAAPRQAPPRAKPEPPKELPGTAEQRAEVRRMLKVDNYYEILGVGKTATGDEIKKAYRKMALKFHPDKNRADGAEKVFKKVSSAYTCLSDDKKRRQYDQYGSEDPRAGAGGGGGGGAHFREDLRPEDIFEMFFNQHGARYGRRNPHYQHRPRQRYRPSPGGGESRSPLSALMQFLPLILLFLFSFMSSPGDEPQFSLNRSGSFPQPRTTPLGTEFFVSNSFQRRYGRDPRSLYHVEELVDKANMESLQKKCSSGRSRAKTLRKKARESRKGTEQDRLMRKAEHVDLSACDRFEELYGNAR